MTDVRFLRNRILATLDDAQRESLSPFLRPARLLTGSVLIAAQFPIKEAYFITEGVASTFTTTKNGQTVQNDFVGREGFVGVPLVLGRDRIPNSTTRMQIGGNAFKVNATVLQTILDKPSRLQLLLRRYAHSQLIRITQTSICNRVHSTEERLACWLLAVSDRVGPEFKATHDMMAQMLGSRRVTLSLRAQELQRAGILWYKHGHLRILNRVHLERIACECYGIQRDEYDGFLR